MTFSVTDVTDVTNVTEEKVEESSFFNKIEITHCVCSNCGETNIEGYTKEHKKNSKVYCDICAETLDENNKTK